MTQPVPAVLPEASREALLKADKSELVDLLMLALQGQRQALEISKQLHDLVAEERRQKQELEDKLASQEAELILLRNRP